jgi:hypothetical protein
MLVILDIFQNYQNSAVDNQLTYVGRGSERVSFLGVDSESVDVTQ